MLKAELVELLEASASLVVAGALVAIPVGLVIYVARLAWRLGGG